MKKCPQCSRTYTDESLEYCPDDRSLLTVSGERKDEFNSETLAEPELQNDETDSKAEAYKVVRSPALSLLVIGILNAVFALALLILFNAGLFIDDQAYPTATIIFGEALFVFGLIGGILTVYGAIQMKKCRNIVSAKMAAVFAVIPLTSCLFVIGMPVGGWALVILSRKEIRAAFQNDPDTKNK